MGGDNIATHRIAFPGKHGYLQEIAAVHTQCITTPVNNIVIPNLKVGVERTIVFTHHAFEAQGAFFFVRSRRVQIGAQIVIVTVVDFILLIFTPVEQAAVVEREG